MTLSEDQAKAKDDIMIRRCVVGVVRPWVSGCAVVPEGLMPPLKEIPPSSWTTSAAHAAITDHAGH